MAIEDFYVDGIEILRLSTSGNGMGGSSETWIADTNTISGLINQADSGEIELASKLDIKATHKLFCDISVNISNQNRIRYNSEIYRVVSKPKDTVNQNHHYKIMLEYVGDDNV
jgi:head-tail adaptor